ncbi:unnamed protein product [Durusdinium trenchii]|uniref:ATP-grasp domain-containing protein n=1 Tax=Durusdinium trenchii TaxID=1381693 RepID=A0ABP0QZP4_9DINO
MGCGSSQAAAAALPKAPIQVKKIQATQSTAKQVAVVLPGSYLKLLAETRLLSSENEHYTYHILDPWIAEWLFTFEQKELSARDQETFSMFRPFHFHVDSFVESAIEYCKANQIEGVFGFDCFPSLVASIINTSLNLPGPSFRSVFHCISKYYMRKELSPQIPMTVIDPRKASPPQSFPVVIKEIDCQFYVGTWIIESEEQWHSTMKILQSRSSEEINARKKFYFKWFQKLHPNEMPVSRWEDFVIFHMEPFLPGKEHQIEIVMEQENHLLVADTGDIIKKDGVIGMFVTPGSFDIPTEWAHDICKKLHAMGYKNQAIDLEFIFTKDGPQVVEINSSAFCVVTWCYCDRYEVQSESSQLKHKADLRNLENRVCSCLGLPCPKFPSDTNVVSKLAVAIYTTKGGKVEDIVDLDFLKKFVAEGYAECWTPKPAFKQGCKEFVYGGGKWAKLGFMMLTAKRTDFEATNAKLRVPEPSPCADRVVRCWCRCRAGAWNG